MRAKALTFLSRNWCSVYLILDEAAFNQGKIKIDAYFTLSHKSLIPNFATKNKIKIASGFKDAESIHFVLIGQLGKYIERSESLEFSSDITAKEILDFAFDVIHDANILIPCRCALVECSDNLKIQKIYKDYGFLEFQNTDEHHQLIRRI